MRRFWAVVVLLAASACPTPPGPADAQGDDFDRLHPSARRYAEEVMPYRVHPELAVTRDLVFNDGVGNLGWPFSHARSMLAAFAALPRLVVLVFPSAERDGLDLAYAGVDQPWSRVPLNELALDDVGDVAATAGPGDVVHVLVRERRGARKLTLYRWTPDGGVTSEEVPRPWPTNDVGFDDRCEDLSLVANASGRVDVVFRQFDGITGHSYVWHGRREAGGGWALRFALGTETLPPPAVTGLSLMNDLGCRSRLALDDTGEPVLVTLRRHVEREATSSHEQRAHSIGRAFLETMTVRGDGPWTGASYPYFPRPLLRPSLPLSFVPQFDLTWHSAGFLVGAPDDANGRTQLRLISGAVTTTLARRFAPEPANPGAAVGGGLLTIDDCGNPTAWTWDPARGDLWETLHFGHRCSRRGWPVMGRAETVNPRFGLGRYPLVSRGTPPGYVLTYCLVAVDELGACDRAWSGSGQLLAPGLAPDDELPVLRRASIANGAVLATSPTFIELELGNPYPDAVGQRAVLVDAITGKQVLESPTSAGPTVPARLTLGAPLPPGSYVASAAFVYDVQKRDSTLLPSGLTWQYLGREAEEPTIYFRLSDPMEQPNPRTTVTRTVCEQWGAYARDDAGVCFDTTPVNPVLGSWVPVGPLAPLAPHPNSLEEPTLFGPDGGVVATTTRKVGGSFSALEWQVELLGEALYEVRYPATATNWLGGPVHPDDRRLRFMTGPLPPYLVSSVPAHGATGVSPTAPLEVTFNDEVALVPSSVALRRVSDMAPVTLSLVQFDARVWRLLHGGLSAGAEYELTLTNIVSQLGHGLRPDPTLVRFTTAP